MCNTLPAFHGVYLDKDVLWTALAGLHDRECDYLPPFDSVPNRSYRYYAAYRQFTWWARVKLGRHMRRLIPSCAVHKIRQMFPEEDGVYFGFIGMTKALKNHLKSLKRGNWKRTVVDFYKFRKCLFIQQPCPQSYLSLVPY